MPELKNRQHTTQWEQQHLSISEAYFTLAQKLKRFPTQTEVAAHCDIDRNTVGRHLSELQLVDITPHHKIQATGILIGMAKAAKEGDAACAKLWFQLVYGWREKFEHTGEFRQVFDGMSFTVVHNGKHATNGNGHAKHERAVEPT